MNEPMSLTIENVQIFKKNFLELLAGGNVVNVDISYITEIDMAGFQIMVGLVHEALLKKKELHFTGTVSPDFASRILIAGISEETCVSGEQFEKAIKAVC